MYLLWIYETCSGSHVSSLTDLTLEKKEKKKSITNEMELSPDNILNPAFRHNIARALAQETVKHMNIIYWTR